MNTTASTSQLTPEITVSPEVLTLLGEKLYSNPHAIILMRELLQNSLDASKDGQTIEILVDSQLDSITVIDDGCGMNHETIQYFLGLGKSFKMNSDIQPDSSVGGFGIAKVSIFTSPKWSVKTNMESDYRISLAGDNLLNITGETSTRRYKKSGTTVYAKCKTSVYYSQMLPYLLISDSIKKTIKFNGCKIKPIKSTDLRILGIHEYKGKRYTISAHKPVKMTYKWLYNGDFSSRDTDEIGGYIIYRINGLPQYITRLWDNSDLILFVDFNGLGFRPTEENYPFSLSRETVDLSVSRQAYKYIEQLSADKMSKNDIVSDKQSKFIERIKAGIYYQYKRGESSRFSLNDKRIVKCYFEIVQDLAKSLTISEDLGKIMVGLTTDHEINASFGKRSNSTVFWLNTFNLPALNKETRDSFILYLYTLACHEITHYWHKQHDESFTCKLDSNFSVSTSRFLANMPIYRRRLNAAI